MIVYKKGDIVKALKDGDIDVLAHGTNCSGGFGSGVAGAIAKEWPDVKKRFIENKNPKLGSMFSDEVEGVMHLYTQWNYGYDGQHYVDYEAIKKCMEQMAMGARVRKHNVPTAKPFVMAIPKIGAGLGGGDWNVIEKIIAKAFFGTEIWVYEL